MNIKYQISNIKITNQKSPPQRLADSPKSLVKKIISNKKIKDNYFEIIVEAPEIAKSAQPGQFVNIKVSDGIEPLLRRPLSIHRVGHQPPATSHQSKKNKEIVILYEVLGKGTEMLSRKKSGEYLSILGPLGNGFRITNQGSGIRILVAGGMGTAPLIFLAEKSMKIKNQKSKIKNIVLIGAKSKSHILCEKEFRDLGYEVKIATNDGSRGFKGYVSELLKQELSTIDYRLSTIYACGPKLLLKEISRISQEYNISAQLSLESHMACGIGVCMGCVIKTKDVRHKALADARQSSVAGEGRGTKNAFRYKRVCKEGPVFAANQILWE